MGYYGLFCGGKLVDTVIQPLGLRRFEFDSDAGFVLNGGLYPLRGVAIHQDYTGRN
jgi:beta-galactosidase